MKKKIIAIVLCIAIVVGAMPVVAAQGTINDVAQDMIDESVAQSASEPYIVGELTEKRTENTKHFLMSDRSVVAAVYDEAVHYNDNGAWVDIDNSLSSNSENDFENKSNSFKTKFSKKSNGNKLVTITKDNYSLSWMLDNANKVNAQISPSNETETEDISVLKNIQGTVTYPNIQNNVDLQYVVSGEDTKENIILQSADAPMEYTFKYKFNTLSYRTNENGQIEFYDENHPENIVFIIDAPYMYDSVNAYSNNIEMQISETSNGFTLNLIPDKDWLLSVDRVYPVVIDPTTLSSQKATSVWDIEVRNTQTSAFWYKAGDFLVGSDSSGQVYRTLLKFCDLPNIGAGGIVVNAKMNITAYQGPAKDGDPALRTRPTDDIQVNVHRITANWPEQGVVWNDYANSYNSTVEDYFVYNDTSEAFVADITKLVIGWYEGNYSNYGVMLKANSEAAGNRVMQFASSDWGVNNTNSATWRPILLVNYRTCIGLEDYWSYTTQDMGGYGTGYVNNYNGNLTYIHEDTSFNSIINGFTLSHVYNGANSNSSTGRYGKGWGLNLVQTFKPVTIENNTAVKFVYIDGDGTKHYFIQLDDGSIVDEDGLGYTYSLIAEGELIYKLTDKDKNVLKFDQWGALRRIIDTNGNTINLNYSPVPNQFNYLSSITTSSGGVFALKYDSNYVLTSITDNAGRVISYSYSNGNLTKIIYPDGTDLDFNYYSGANGVAGSTSWLHGVTLPNGYKYRYGNYDNGKIYMSTEEAVSGTQINKYYYTYSNNKTNVRDLHGRHINYLFDSFGRVTCAYDSQGNCYSEAYTSVSTAEDEIFANNKLSLTSSNIRNINNLITNPSFADGLSSWSQYKEAPSETEISVVSDQAYVSSKSVKISSTASSIQALLQSPSTTAGKTYTLSANIKTENVISATHGATVEIVKSTPNGNSYFYDFVTGSTDPEINNGFVTVRVTVSLASNENIARIGVGLYNASGTMWVDSVQLEEGDTANKINLLSNSSFEKNTGSSALPTGYTANFTAGTAGGSTSADKHSGSYSLKISGSATVKRYAYQTLNLSGKAGDVYSMGGWARANAVANHSSNGVTDFKLTAGVYYTNGDYVEFPFDLNEYTTEWQYVFGNFVMKNDYNKILIYCSYNYNANTAYFDDMFLYRDTAQSYTYDENGNVVSTADYAKQQSTFEYSDSYLSKTVEPIGTKYTYKYDDEKNLVNASSNIGIDYNIAYDTYGNATQTTIVPGGAPEITQYSAVYYIKNKSSGQYLTVSGGECVRANINQQPLTNAPLQRWRVKKLSNGNYIMRPDGCNEHAIAFENRSVVNTTVLLGVTGADIETYDWSQWRLIANNDEEHSFKIKTMATNCVTQYISIAASDTTNGGNIYMDYDGSTDNKSWIFIPAKEIITSSATYQNNGNYPHTVTDSLGNTTTYTYDTARGIQTEVTDASGNTTEYCYDPDNDRLDYVVSGGSIVEYYYNSVGQLTGIDSPSGTIYSLTYDEFGNTKQIYMGPQSLTTNTYDTSRGLLMHSVYGNGQKVGYTYDILDRVTEKLYNDVVKVKYRYDKFGNLYEKQDLFTDTTYRYNYDLTGRITGVLGNNNTSLNYVYDDYNRVKKFIAKVSDNTNSTEYIYGDSDVSGQKDGLIYGVMQNGVERLSYGYDRFARLSNKTINTTTPFEISYNYLTNYSEGKTSTVLRSMVVGYDTHNYFYDAVGNIVRYNVNGTNLGVYTYDANNQLKTETRDGDVYEYNYDNGGNIQSITKNGQSYKSYTYGDSEWRDLLTAFNGDTITYDQIGNPLQYRDSFEFTWSNGRQLTSVYESDYHLTTTYTYNADGLRASKNQYGMIETQYYWLDGVLIGEKTGDKYTIFLYDDAGIPYGIIYDGIYYYYVQNAQGDIVALLDADGEIVAQYEYDAWGNTLSITDSNNNAIINGGHIAHKNPLRYRGYYYDEETGFYYLQSRYYDPVTCRFINADGLVSTGQGVLGSNMFAYCGNNPVNRVDPSGCFWRLIVIAVVVVGVLVATLTGCDEPPKKSDLTSSEQTQKPTPKPTSEVEKLKKSPTELKHNGDSVSTYATESDTSVVARMLYGEDHNSIEAHLWVIENRKMAGNYGGSDPRSLILAPNQFSCMTTARSLKPASLFGEHGEIVAWEKCVEMADLYVTYGISAIPKPSADFNYTWTYQYSSWIAEKYPDGVRIGGTWFYNK